MENIAASFLSVTVIFFAYSIAVYQSKKACQPASVGVVSSPDSSLDETIVQPDSTPDMPIEGDAVMTAQVMEEYPITKRFTANNSLPDSVADKAATELSGLTIRQLKRLACRKKIKRYGHMTKPELIEACFATCNDPIDALPRE